MQVLKSLILSLGILCLYGCATAKISKVADDTYIISKSDMSPGFGPSKTLKGEVQEEANKLAEKQKKVVVPLSIKSSPAFPLHFASVEYRFKLLDKSDAIAIRSQELPFPEEGDTSRAEKLNGAIAQTGSKPDNYSELIKLDELRKKGILSQTEFDAEKKKLLSKP